VGLTFLNGAFLAAALAALIPLVIHLISRRRVEVVDFSSLRFLKELERKRIRRVRLRQILLLIVRSLIILAVALALARPTLKGALAGVTGSHARTSIAIVIDDSASMSRESDSRRLFDEALAITNGIVDLLDEVDQAFLITASETAASLFPDGTFSRDALREALGALDVSAGATDYDGAVAMARDLLGSARNLNREIYVVGDLQRSGWGGGQTPVGVSESNDAGAAGGSGDADAAGGSGDAGGANDPTVDDGGDAPEAPDVADDIRAYLIPFTGPEGNTGVVSADVSRKYGGTAGLFSVSAEIRNYGRRPLEFPARLFLDGIQVAQAGVTLDPDGSAVAKLATFVDESAWHAGWIELPDDALAADNRWHFTIPPARRTEVLVVRADGQEARDDAYYIERALDPTGASDRFAPVTIEAAALGRQERGRFPAVVLADVGRLDADGERWVEDHVADGGGLLLVLGSKTDMRYWNTDLLPALTGITLRETLERASGVRLAPAGTGHPLLDGLVFGERLIDEVGVRRGFLIDGAPEEEILELPGLGPALVLARVGTSGEVAALLTGVDPSWSDLPTSGFLIPLLHRLVGQLGGTSVGEASAIVGEELAVPLPETIAGRIDVLLPGERTEIASVTTGRRRAASLARVVEPGIYRFESGGTVVALGAVNVDPRESNLAAATPTDIAALAPGLDFRVVSPDEPLEGAVLEARHGRELWRVLVYAALALIALEMFLARPRLA